MLRFAPSPTGDMHIGNLRAAIFNYIIAKQRGEKFLIRIEDTDSARNIEGADKEILEILNLFGLFWDKLVYQSENFPLHRKLAQNLIEKNKAFYCYATKDFLEQKREEASAQKRAFRYKDEWAEVCKGENEKPVIRLKGIVESNVGNSVLGMQFRTCKNFRASTDSSLVESPKIFTNTKATPQSLPLRFCESQNLGENQTKIAESTLDSADSQNLGENISSLRDSAKSQNLIKKELCEAPENSPASWCKKSESKGAVVPPADFLLEADKRGSPPKSEKAAAFWRVGGAGRGVQPFLREEISEIDEKNSDRFKESITFFDAIKGECKFSQNEIDSFVILRDDIPTYNFACAVDDMLYDISFIIRGEDHTSNTPRQMLIHRALGYDREIKFAHLPIILNNEGKKMSKRENESSVKWLLSQGFLPRAIVNYLLLMGNNPPCEIFTLDDAIAWFDLSQLSKSPVRFDINQLRYINREHLKRLGESEMGLLLESSSELLSQIAGNSSSGLHSADFANLGRFADLYSVSHPKFAKNHESQTENPSVVDSALAQNLGENLPIHCHSERSEESQKNNIVILSETKNLKNNQNRDSSVASLPQNDNFKKIAESKIIKSLGAIGKIFLEEASTLNELNDKLNHIFAPKDLKNFEFGENARILKGEILRLLAESSAESGTKPSAESGTKPSPLDDFESLKSALSKNAPFKGKAFFMPLRFLLTGAQKGPHLDTLYPHLRPFLTQILKD